MLAGFGLWVIKWFRILNHILFPIRGNMLEFQRNCIELPYDCLENNSGVMQTYKIILPKMTAICHWDRVYALYSILSDTDDDNSEENLVEDNNNWIDVTDIITTMAGPQKNFLNIPTTIEMLNSDFIELKFVGIPLLTKKEISLIFLPNEIISLTPFEYKGR
jgi:hypothetical protein